MAKKYSLVTAIDAEYSLIDLSLNSGHVERSLTPMLKLDFASQLLLRDCHAMALPPPRTNWRIFTSELIIYALLVFAYFGLVLHYLSGWLVGLYHTDRNLFAVMALVLMIGQAVGLEIISSLLFKLVEWKKK